MWGERDVIAVRNSDDPPTIVTRDQLNDEFVVQVSYAIWDPSVLIALTDGGRVYIRPLESSANFELMSFSPHTNVVITQVAQGAHASFYVCKSGRVFVNGRNTMYCMGIPRSQSIYFVEPQLMNQRSLQNERCVSVACAGLSTRFVTLDPKRKCHNIFSAGSNMYGEGATGGTVPDVLTRPVKVRSVLMKTERVKKISTGDHSYLMLTESGRLFVNGYNDNEQLFITSSMYILQITEIKRNLGCIADIASHSSHHAFLTTKGSLYVSKHMFPSATGRCTELNLDCRNIRSVYPVITTSHDLLIVTEENKVYLKTGTQVTEIPHNWDPLVFMNYRVESTFSNKFPLLFLNRIAYPVLHHFPSLDDLQVLHRLSDIDVYTVYA